MEERMNWYYAPGSGKIKAHRMTLLDRYRMWKAFRRRAKMKVVWYM